MLFVYEHPRLVRTSLAIVIGAVSLAAAGCGSGANVAAVTPVMADTKGTYRLASTSVALTAAGGSAATFPSYSTGTLRIFDDGSYRRTVALQDQKTTDGHYFFGPTPTTTSATTILNSREGAFVLSSADPAQPFRGSYEISGDFVLVLNYPDQGLGARSNTWVKISDSPRQ